MKPFSKLKSHANSRSEAIPSTPTSFCLPQEEAGLALPRAQSSVTSTVSRRCLTWSQPRSTGSMCWEEKAVTGNRKS